MKRLTVFLLVAAVVLATATAWAEYGTWTVKNSDWNYNNTLFGVMAPTADDIFSIGVWSDNISTFRFIYRSRDAGETLDCVYEWSLSPDPAKMCEILKITDARTCFWMHDENTGVFGGLGAPQSCYDLFGPSPAGQMICIIFCALQLKPSIWFTEDGGDTYSDANVPGELGQSVQALHFPEANAGYAVGLDDFIAKSTDGGENWTMLPSISSAYAGDPAINHIFCLDENTCWIAVGEWDPEEEPTDLEGAELAQYLLHKMMLSTDPLYREEYWRTATPAKKSKYVSGAILRTDDGGQTWTLQQESTTEGYGWIYFKDENVGWATGNEYVPPAPEGDGGKNIFKMYWTQDGGATWANYLGHIPVEFPGLVGGWSPSGIKCANENFCILYGYGARVMNYGPAFMWSDDGGETWTADEVSAALNGGQMDLFFVNHLTAYSVGLYLNLMKYEGVNGAPIADAGDDQTVPLDSQVVLDGSGSYDPDGDPLTYAWSQYSGPLVTLDGDDTAAPTFTATQTGDVVLQLVVSDGFEDSAVDEVVITVSEDIDDDTSVDDDTAPVDDDTTPDDDDTVDDDTVDDDDVTPDDSDDDDDDSNGCGCQV